jgi:hypothetical protein
MLLLQYLKQGCEFHLKGVEDREEGGAFPGLKVPQQLFDELILRSDALKDLVNVGHD